MRHRTSTTAGIAALLAAGAALAACGDDGATGPGEAGLSADQAREIAESVVREVGVVGFAGAGSSTQSSLVARDVAAATTSTFDIESGCAGGGTVSFSGELVTDTEGAGSSLDGELVYDECTRTPSDETITLTTRPAFDLTSDLQLVSDTELQMDTGLVGPFDWEIGGDAGSCVLDLDSSLSVIVSSDGTTVTVSATTVGRVCGHEIDRSFETTVSTS